MNTKFAGTESYQDFKALISPLQIVEREMVERGSPDFLRDRILLQGNSYDFNEKWAPNEEELQHRWNISRSRVLELLEKEAKLDAILRKKPSTQV
jgi:hypothetical protein